MTPVEVYKPRPVEINKPGHLAHGMKGHTTAERMTGFVVDVDGVEMFFLARELLFIAYRPVHEPRIDYWLRNFFWFVIGVAFGILARMLQE